jgi:hypothetical protein
MFMTLATRFRFPSRTFSALAACIATMQLAGCGGGGNSNPLDNPPVVNNPVGTSGQRLSFVYFQKCINPIFLAQLQVNNNGTISTNTCASSGCHDDTSGTGGAFRVVQSAQAVDLADPANTPDAVRTTDMYRNFYSAQGSVVIGNAAQSRLLTKPLVRNVLHGGGLIFLDDNDPNARLIQYWISRPVPQGADEFSPTAANMFTPADPNTGACNTQ